MSGKEFGESTRSCSAACLKQMWTLF